MIDLDALVELWHGDDNSTGYMSEELVVAACRIAHPTGVIACLRIFYPGYASSTDDGGHEQAADVIRKGFDLYQRRLGLERRHVSRVQRALGR